jgi:hypothetical protein
MLNALTAISNEIELQMDVTGLAAKTHDVGVEVRRPHLAVRAPRSVAPSPA